MIDITIHNFRYFLEELQNNLRTVEISLEQQSTAIRNMHVHGVMSKMCQNWDNQLKHQ